MAPKRRSVSGLAVDHEGDQKESRGDEGDDKLDAVWGHSGTWFVTAQLPQRKLGERSPVAPEQPYSIRSLTMQPKTANPDALLKGWGISALNTKGYKGEGDIATGQDNFSIALLDEGWEVFCVFDGHGKNGHWPATRGARALPAFLRDAKAVAFLRNGDAKSALLHAFARTEAHIERQALKESVDLTCNGSTASVVLRHPDKDIAWIATLGDSRVVLIVPGIGVTNESRDHKPTDLVESKRIRQSGGDIRSETHDGFTATRVFRPKENIPGLGMTRSLGDLSVKEFGVIATPEVVEWPLAGKRNGLILAASDGIWEFLDGKDAAQIVLKRLDQGAEALLDLLKVSRAKWKEDDDLYCDDITALLIPLTAGTAAPCVPGNSASGGLGMCFGGICSTCSMM